MRTLDRPRQLLTALALAFGALGCGTKLAAADGGTPAICDPPCQAGLSCNAGQCVPATCAKTPDCPAGFNCQGGFCASGVCAIPCAPDQICSTGICVNENPCGPHEIVCGTGAAAYCTNLSQDSLNCGACGQLCAQGEACARGVCAPSCLQNETLCGKACADLTTDGHNCGACGRACAAGQVCSAGACAASCSGVDGTVCGEKQAQYCADIYDSPFDCGGCGTTCGSGTYCTQGICRARCGGLASQLCDGICVDLQTDLESCGGCGHACPSGQVCYGGDCVATCGFPYLTCGAGTAGHCANLLEDVQNCGACGQDCAVGSVCAQGQCAADCRSGTACPGLCVGAQTDSQNCGACGVVCPEGAHCNGFGECSTVCGLGFNLCGSGPGASCTNVQADTQNCGACGSPCAAGESCVGGGCTAGPLDAGVDGGTADDGADGGAPCGCGLGLTCIAGVCHSQSCEALACASGFACLDGGCVQDGCTGISCPSSETCGNGQCFPTSCAGVACDGGACWQGGCVTPRCAGLVCPAGQICAAGICQPGCASGCTAPHVCLAGACQPGCTIAGQAYGLGTLNPANYCQICDPATDPGGWTGINAGNACAGGNVCTNGLCASGCAIDLTGYAAGTTNPANGCQACIPAISTVAWSAANDDQGCGDGKICRGGGCLAGCLVGAAFLPPNAGDPENSCESCQPLVSTRAFSPSPDQTPCANATGGDVCVAGQCTSTCAVEGAACGATGAVCHNSSCTLGCFIGGTYVSPGAPDPDAGAGAACCSPPMSTATFSPQWAQLPHGGGTGMIGMAPADLGGGLTGIVTANPGGKSISVLLRNANGTYNGATAYGTGQATEAAGVGDVTGDGIPDLIGCAANSSSLTFFPGLGNGLFGAETTIINMPNLDLIGVAPHFFPNGQGAILTEDYNAGPRGPLRILTINPDGGLDFLQAHNTSFFWSVTSAGQQSVIADLNGDGLDDLALTGANQFDDRTAVLINDGNGDLGGEADYFVGQQPSGLAAAPFFGHRYPSGAPVLDLVTFVGASATLVVLENDGSGNFTQAVSLVVSGLATSSSAVIAVAAGDFNGDGFGDAALLVAGSPNVVQIFLGNGPGTLTPGPTFPTSLSGSAGGNAMLSGPFEPDGSWGFFSMTTSTSFALWRDDCR